LKCVYQPNSGLNEKADNGITFEKHKSKKIHICERHWIVNIGCFSIVEMINFHAKNHEDF